jgi:uncharacterized protein (DUF952 family)
MLIYKIFRGSEWANMQTNGQTDGAPVDLADGFIHFSGSDTVAKTAELYFADLDDLILIAVEADGLDGLKWEESRGGAANYGWMMLFGIGLCRLQMAFINFRRHYERS